MQWYVCQGPRFSFFMEAEGGEYNLKVNHVTSGGSVLDTNACRSLAYLLQLQSAMVFSHKSLAASWGPNRAPDTEAIEEMAAAWTHSPAPLPPTHLPVFTPRVPLLLLPGCLPCYLSSPQRYLSPHIFLVCSVTVFLK